MSIFSKAFSFRRYFVRLILLCSGTLVSIMGYGQVPFSLQPEYFSRFESQLLKYPNSHVVIKPIMVPMKYKLHLIDSVFGKSRDVLLLQRGKLDLRVNPVLQSSYRMGGGFYIHQAVGVQVEGEAGKKFSFELSDAAQLLSRAPFLDTRMDSAGIVDHFGTAWWVNASDYLFHDFRGRVTYSPNRYLSLSIGRDKSFFGDGYRSLFLSDNAPAYPFFSVSLNVWHFKYLNQVMLMKDYQVGKSYSTIHRKYAAMHIISWDVTRKWNLNVFEAVVWRMDDTVGHQNIDVNYMNPFIFYRPQEYMLGSPDNVLIGIGSRLRVLPSSYIYGQFLLDEFYLKEILSSRGWWANKNAVQAGIKCFKLFGIPNLYLQAEYNQSRPFTYGHDYPMENYGYLLQPLAHPLGTNFREGICILRYGLKRWQVNTMFSLAKYGREPGGKTIGADIYLSSNNRFEFNANDDGNFIGQGIGVKEWYQKIELTHLLNPRWGLEAEAGLEADRMVSTTTTQTLYVTFGIRTLLNREEKLF